MNGQITVFDDMLPHIVSEVICVRCGKRWIAARPEETKLKNLECSSCGSGFVIETGEKLEKEDCGTIPARYS